MSRDIEGSIRAYPDGSTDRHVRRWECQGTCIYLREAIGEKDLGGVLEAWEELRNDAERAFCWRWFTVKQREVIRIARRLGTQRCWKVHTTEEGEDPPGRFFSEGEAASWALAHYGGKDIAWTIERVSE